MRVDRAKVRRDLITILKLDFNSNDAPNNIQCTFLIVYLLLQRTNKKKRKRWKHRSAFSGVGKLITEPLVPK